MLAFEEIRMMNKKIALVATGIIIIALALIFSMGSKNNPNWSNVNISSQHHLHHLETGQRGILENGYTLFFENATACTPGKDGSLNIKILTPSGGTLSTSALWFGSFEAKLGNQTKKISVAAINGFSRDDVEAECFYGEGLREIKNTSIWIT